MLAGGAYNAMFAAQTNCTIVLSIVHFMVVLNFFVNVSLFYVCATKMTSLSYTQVKFSAKTNLFDDVLSTFYAPSFVSPSTY